LQHYPQWPSFGKSQDAPQLKNGLRKCDIYTQWSFIQPQRKMKFYCLPMSGLNWRSPC
jgi:hypothetical protein